MTDKPKILLVDDLDFFLEMEMDYLRQTPAEIFTAKNGLEALEIARLERPHLIYMDVQMPEMDGLTCCQMLKADPALAEIPVVMIFTETKDMTVGRVKLAGCEAALPKPVSRGEFLDVGRRFLFQVDRREVRVPCQTTVDFRINGIDHQGMCVDLSENGLYIHFRDPVPKVEVVYVSFLLPTISRQPVEVRGRIAWVNQGFPRPNLEQPQGFGVQFINLPEEGRELIQTFIERYGSLI